MKTTGVCEPINVHDVTSTNSCNDGTKQNIPGRTSKAGTSRIDHNSGRESHGARIGAPESVSVTQQIVPEAGNDASWTAP